MNKLIVFALVALSLNARAQTVDELREQLKERDARIQRLQKRIDDLESDRSSKSNQEQAPADADIGLDRALERTLVQQGGLVLPRRTYEVEPQLAYSHWDPSRSSFRNETETAVALRAGIGWDSQIQVRVPYMHVATANGSETALGDIDLSLSSQLLPEGPSRPGLVTSLMWTTHTGKDGATGAPPTGSGFNVLQASVTAVKRHDPLVFFGGVSYAKPMEREVGGVKAQPGDILGVRMGTILATSPDTSVNVGLNLGFVSAARLGGQTVPNSETTLGTLRIGVSTILTRRAMLNVSTDIRVSGDVPDFRLSATLPIRF